MSFLEKVKAYFKPKQKNFFYAYGCVMSIDNVVRFYIDSETNNVIIVLKELDDKGANKLYTIKCHGNKTDAIDVLNGIIENMKEGI